ncbi:MAG TPA: hypothetical protein VGQ36_16280, partial [Thermoanaerobaculia bacterium]|nr:hypothetical protein [Thermoanaerobaculia bacterium]
MPDAVANLNEIAGGIEFVNRSVAELDLIVGDRTPIAFDPKERSIVCQSLDRASLEEEIMFGSVGSAIEPAAVRRCDLRRDELSQ